MAGRYNMKFEDLFKVKEPTNYVEQASGGQDPLMKFFEERTVKAQKAKQPITPQKEAAIKKIFTIDPQQIAPEEPTEDDGMDKAFEDAVALEEPAIPEIPAQQESLEVQTKDPAISIPDLTKKEQKELSLSDKAEAMLPERTWVDFLPYLTPFLVKGLTGSNVNAAEIDGTSLLKSEADRMKRKQTFEDKLLEMDKARLSRKMTSVKFQPKALRDKTTGESLIGSYDPTTDTMYVGGNPVDTSNYELAPGISRQEFEARSGITQRRQQELGDYFGRGVRLDPDTGLLARVINGKLVPIQVQKGRLNPQQTRNLEKIVNSYKSSDVYKKNADTLKFATTVQEFLAEGNPVAIEMARSELAKAAEGGGRLSDADIARLGGPSGIRDKIDRFVYLQDTGEEATPKDVAYMQRVADILESKARRALTQSIIGLEEDFIQKGGIPGAVQTSLNPYAPQLAEKPTAEKGMSGMVMVKDKDGNEGHIPRKNLNKALKKGFKVIK